MLAGCDSTLTIHLTVNKSSQQTIRRTACDSYELNGHVYTQSGTYTQNLTTETGCDLTITLILTINKSTEETIEVTDCNVVSVNGIDYTTSGTYTQNLTNAAGCDSTLTIIVTVGDTISPVASCKDIVAQLDNNGIYTLTAEDIDNGSTDNCSIDTMFIDKDQFTCDDLGENQVTLTVIDARGNVSTCTSTVVIEAGSYDCGNGQLTYRTR